MKRPLSLVAFILATVFTAVYNVILIIGLTAIFPVLSDLSKVPGGSTVVIILFLQVAVFLITMILDIVGIAKSTKAPDVYKKGAVITATVFNFITAITLLFTELSILPILVIVVLVAANVLVYVDLSKEGKRRAQYGQGAQPAFQAAPQAPAFPQQPAQPQQPQQFGQQQPFGQPQQFGQPNQPQQPQNTNNGNNSLNNF